MKMDFAYFCIECREVFERAARGCCPVCGSEQIRALAWYTDYTPQQREEWQTRIYRGTCNLNPRS
jgi:rRNA maturation endonuclease Nob1